MSPRRYSDGVHGARVSLGVCLLSAMLGCGSAPATKGSRVGRTEARVPLEVRTFTLKNGLQLILAEDHRTPIVAVNLWYRVGGKDDPPQRSGLAHLFEHLMF